MQGAHTVHRRQTLLDDALEVMRAQHAAPRLSLNDVATQIATSRRQLQRCFSELAHGETYRDCLTRIRMEQAAELLASSSLAVRNIALEVGYLEPAQFSKAFRRVYGISPVQYRRAQQAGVLATG